MKHITIKAAKNSNQIVIGLGYCELQRVLSDKNKVAYNAGVYGWNFDLYKINDKYSIVTGYRHTARASDLMAYDNPALSADLAELEAKAVNEIGKTISRDELASALIETLDKHLA